MHAARRIAQVLVDDMTDIERFTALFAGLRRAYGSYTLDGTTTAKGKRPGRAVTEQKPLTDALYERHLTTSWTLGVIPIREDSTCTWGALDIDVYRGLDHKKVVADIQRAQLPLVAVRSKSGGLHLYVFLARPLAAADFRAQLKTWAAALGFPSVEIFPKQEALAADEVGNWINLPYAGALMEGGYGTERYGYDDNGASIASLSAWLDYAAGKRIESDAFASIAPRVSVAGVFSDGPPCIQTLAAERVTEGGRNNAMYQMAVYAKLKHGDQFGDAVNEYNAAYFDPPLSLGEINTIIKSVQRRDYFYKCKDQPCAAVCRRSTCLTRPFGLGEGRGAQLEYGDLSKQVIVDQRGRETRDAPIYYWTVNGSVLTLTGDQLMSQQQFRRVVMERLNVLPAPVRKDVWDQLVNDKLEAVTVVHAPFEAGRVGQFMSVLWDFVREFAKGRRWDALVTGLVYVCDEGGQRRAYFRWQDLRDHMERRRCALNNHEAWNAMQEYADAQSGEKKVRGQKVRYWCVTVPADLLIAPVPDDSADF